MTSSNCFQRSANQDAFCVFLHCGNLVVLSVAMADISWAALLQPLEASAAATAVLVLQLVPIPLAGAVLRSLAWAWHKQSLAPNSSENVVWKVARYLPLLTCGQRTVAPLLSSLKDLQKDCPTLPVVRVSSARSQCSCGHDLQEKAPVAEATIANNAAASRRTSSNRYKVYSLNAGLLWADFVEQHCPACRKYFLGNWSFKRQQSGFGHMSNLQCQSSASDGFFLIPRYRSFFAVEIALLKHLTDSLHFSGGSMKAAVLVWAMRHSETWQQDLLLGPDRTQLPHTISNLLSAWYAWRAFDMAGPLAEHIVWDVTPTGFDASLLAHTAAIREQHLDWVAAHIKACPRCRDNPCVIVDGKAGARRLICAGQSRVYIQCRLLVIFVPWFFWRGTTIKPYMHLVLQESDFGLNLRVSLGPYRIFYKNRGPVDSAS